MPNSPAENELIRNAFRVAAFKYADWFPQDDFRSRFIFACLSKSGDVPFFVKFQDDPVFTMTRATTQSAKLPGNCRVCGFTAPVLMKPGEWEIYINRLHANHTTVVHELFHFFTHQNFMDRVPPNLNEAVTEYFTRKALGRAETSGWPAQHKEGFQVAGRKDRYEDHHGLLKMGRDTMKPATKAAIGKNYMKRAYFKGEDAAIKFVLEQMGALEDLLKLE